MITYLQVENLSKHYGELILFNNINFQVSEGQKIALIAKNGTGKSSLFNILCGNDTPDTGNVTFHKDITIGFLEQDPAYDPNKTVLEQVFASDNEVVRAIRDYELALETDNKQLLANAIDILDHQNAWDYEARVKQILGQLKVHGFDQKMSTLSGGQRKRVALANALITKPDLLILDEPTNHLDLEVIEWLEEFLTKGNFTLLMVTHDRYFLDRVCTEILEFDNKQLYKYAGNYSYYIDKRADRLENEQMVVDKARNLMRKELDWIRRQPKARGTKAKYRVDNFERIKETASQGRSDKDVEINVMSARLGSKIINAANICKCFGDNNLIEDFSYNFARFEKAGIVGPNGVGKSTFLNILTGALQPDKGTLEHGETVKVGYYKQDGMAFNEQMRVIDVVTNIAEVVTLSDGSTMSVSSFLNFFLFPPQTQYSYVYKLSGGEKRRLYLCTVLMQNPNFLILDEPTNDLDIVTLQVLEDYLQSFQGCLLIVSHDRFFMDKVVDHLFVFEGNGKIKDFPGNYSDYREWLYFKENAERKPDKQDKQIAVQASASEKPQTRKATFNEKREYEQLTAEIDKLETEKKQIETELSNGKLTGTDVVNKSQRFTEITNLLDEKGMRWLELSEIVN